jgi:hypothetical protein
MTCVWLLLYFAYAHDPDPAVVGVFSTEQYAEDAIMKAFLKKKRVKKYAKLTYKVFAGDFGIEEREVDQSVL